MLSSSICCSYYKCIERRNLKTKARWVLLVTMSKWKMETTDIWPRWGKPWLQEKQVSICGMQWPQGLDPDPTSQEALCGKPIPILDPDLKSLLGDSKLHLRGKQPSKFQINRSFVFVLGVFPVDLGQRKNRKICFPSCGFGVGTTISTQSGTAQSSFRSENQAYFQYLVSGRGDVWTGSWPWQVYGDASNILFEGRLAGWQCWSNFL